MSTQILERGVCTIGPGASLWRRFWSQLIALREEKARMQVAQHLLRRTDDDLASLGLPPQAIAHLRQHRRLPNPLAR